MDDLVDPSVDLVLTETAGYIMDINLASYDDGTCLSLTSTLTLESILSADSTSSYSVNAAAIDFYYRTSIDLIQLLLFHTTYRQPLACLTTGAALLL